MALFVVLLSAVAVIVLYNSLQRYRNLLRNQTEARKSGLPFVTTPWHVYSMFWLATCKIWLPLLRKFLPSSCHGLWLDVLDPQWPYHSGHEPFAKIGSDVFLVVSPSKNNCMVADAGVITQITTRRNDFPKPLEIYKGLDIYGKNVVSTEGSDWRKHRRVIANSFGEKNNGIVWTEALHHANELLEAWTGPNQSGNLTVRSVAADTMSFALYIISRAGFGVRVQWPHEENESPITTEPKDFEELTGSVPPPGHEMSYRRAVSSLLEGFVWTQIFPVPFLKRSPWEIHREVGHAVGEWGNYMNALYTAKASEVASNQEDSPGIDLFHSMIRSTGILDPDAKHPLQKSDILGNAFVLMIAGHETTGNALHYSFIYLAMHMQSQKRLQHDIDVALQNRPIETWTYEDDFPKLFDAMPAAVMNETLRLLQPIINIPKSTAPGSPQPIHINGKEYLIPADTNVMLSCAVHRNPKYWPAPTSQDKADDDDRPDVDKFRPERWLVGAQLEDDFADIQYDDEDLRGPSGEDTSSRLFKPVKGSYIPFSDGHRSCIGRRFAQVEILACFAVIFSQYSIELAVDEYATDEEVEQMPKGGKERREVWKKAADRADFLLTKTLKSMITLQMRDGHVPLRLVRREEERFVF